MGAQVSGDADFKPRLLVESTAKFHINAPTADIDIPDWVFNVPEQEYIDCTPYSHGHLSAAVARTIDGRRVSINVEDVGGVLIVEHYLAEIEEKLHCRLSSISDLRFDGFYTTANVVWELIATHKAGDEHEFTNNVWIYTTPKFEAFLEGQRRPFEMARSQFQQVASDHNAEETPFFAAAIERWALAKRK